MVSFRFTISSYVGITYLFCVMADPIIFTLIAILGGSSGFKVTSTRNPVAYISPDNETARTKRVSRLFSSPILLFPPTARLFPASSAVPSLARRGWARRDSCPGAAPPFSSHRAQVRARSHFFFPAHAGSVGSVYGVRRTQEMSAYGFGTAVGRSSGSTRARF